MNISQKISGNTSSNHSKQVYKVKSSIFQLPYSLSVLMFHNTQYRMKNWQQKSLISKSNNNTTFQRYFHSNIRYYRSILKTQTSHKTSVDDCRRVTDECRRLQTSHQTSHQTSLDECRLVTIRVKTSVDKSLVTRQI